MHSASPGAQLDTLAAPWVPCRVIDVSIVESLVSQEEQSSFTLQPGAPPLSLVTEAVPFLGNPVGSCPGCSSSDVGQTALCTPAVRQRRHSQLQTAVEDRLTLIVRTVNDRKDHIPPVVSPSAVTFPFDISITG